MTTFVRRSRLPVSREALYQWHARPGAFERLTPPWTPVEVVERTGGIEDGARLVMRLHAGPVPIRWTAVHRGHQPGRQFQDEQVEGPFRRWLHTHRFLDDEQGGAVLEDQVEFELPGGPLGRLGEPFALRALRRMFRFRHARTAADLRRHAAPAGRPPLRVAVSGASGLIGSQLTAFLRAGGHTVRRLVRRAAGAGDEIAWDPERGTIAAAALAEVDAVVHLAGENVAAGRWSPARKRAIRDSRVRGTRLVAEALASLPRPPRTLVAASAIGIYGDRGDEPCDESAAPGTGFLADVCRDWEAATAPAETAGVRVVHARIGVVLGAAGGALARLVPVFSLGAGGVVGDGGQWVPWIGLEDVVGALHALLVRDDLAGPVNLVAPAPVTSEELARTLGRVLRRPAVLPIPAAAIRLAFGEMGEALLLGSTRVVPRRLTEAGFPFLYPALEGALRHELGRAA